MKMRPSWIFTAFLAMGVHNAYAAELRVLDQKGLSRAVRVVSGRGSVVVRLSRATQESAAHLVLAPVDVISRDVEGEPEPEESGPITEQSVVVRFSSVREGTWQLKGQPGPSEILSVAIVPEAR